MGIIIVFGIIAIVLLYLKSEGNTQTIEKIIKNQTHNNQYAESKLKELEERIDNLESAGGEDESFD